MEQKISCWTLAEIAVENCYRTLLYGPPGTGKTTYPFKVFGSGVISVTLNEDMAAQELLGFFAPKGNEFVWQDGLATLALRKATPLLINEIDKSPPSVFTILLNILDDPEIAQVHLPTDEIIRPPQGFKVIATMNGNPADLPEPLIDRFDAQVYINEPHPDAIRKIQDEKIKKLVLNSYRSSELYMTLRQAISVDKLIQTQDIETSFLLVFPENQAKELINIYKLTD